MVTCPTPLGPGATRKTKSAEFHGICYKNAESARSFFKRLFLSLFFWRSCSKNLCALADILRPRARSVQEYQESSALIFCHERYDNILTSSSSSSSFYSHLFKKKKVHKYKNNRNQKRRKSELVYMS